MAVEGPPSTSSLVAARKAVDADLRRHDGSWRPVVIGKAWLRPLTKHHRRNWKAQSATSISAPPSACTGRNSSPSNATLAKVETSGSRFMINAVLKAPIRVTEMKIVSTETVLATLMPTNATQPNVLCGALQVCVNSENATKIAAEGSSEYQVFSRESVLCKLARVISSDTTRSTAAASALDNTEQLDVAEPRTEHHGKADERGECGHEAAPADAVDTGRPRRRGR